MKIHHPDRTRLSKYVKVIGMTALGFAAAQLTGCANYAHNAPFYKRNVQLTNANSRLKMELTDAKAQIAQLRKEVAAKTPRIATLPPQRLAELFTVKKIQISSDTRTAHLHDSSTRNGFRVFVKTYMGGSMILPATGTFDIQAFDLASGVKHPLIGRWSFSPIQAKKCWYGLFGLDEFGFDCPWKTPPRHPVITFRVKFTDALTGRVFLAQRVLRVNIPRTAH
ncbi:MAG: hypothetical protein ACP5O1_06575 [Phycisphaerae bacterium]